MPPVNTNNVALTAQVLLIMNGHFFLQIVEIVVYVVHYV